MSSLGVIGCLGRIETLLERLEARLERLAEGQAKLREEVAELRGRVANLPTAWLMLTAIVGGQLTLAGLLFVVLRFARGG